MKTYELFTGEELKIAEKIQQRRYQLLIHSCIYYHLNQNIVSDSKWNDWANELVILQENYPDIAKQVKLHEYFSDWDASTGAFLPITLSWVVNTANKLLSYSDKKKEQVKTKSVRRKLF